MPAAIETRDLVKTYKPAYPRGAPGVKALDGLTFAVETGTIFGLLGPNGAGKSTTMKILTTLSRPDSGEARVAGIDVLANPDAVRRVIGYVAQKSGVDPESTGRENLTLQGHLHGMRGALGLQPLKRYRFRRQQESSLHSHTKPRARPDKSPRQPYRQARRCASVDTCAPSLP